MTLVVVTGGAGFIGSHLVTTLVERGFQVRVLDDLSTGNEQNLKEVRERVTFVRGSVTDVGLCKKVCDGARYVWHLAALGSVPRSLRDPLGSNQANVVGTLSILSAAREMGVERVVFASSSSVYGRNANLPQRVGDVLAPASPYAVTKTTGEQYMRVFYECFGIETVALRYFNVYGPRQDPDNPYAAVIPSFVKSLLSGQPPHIEGDGEQSRDFTYIEDCVQATIKAMTAPAAAGKVYNVACGNQTTINRLYQIVANLVGSDIEPQYIDPRPGDIRHSRADISGTITDLGFDPEYTLETGLARSVPWYREHFAGRKNLQVVENRERTG
jgi:nucleoside-diphosphate-sugar epimerase